MKRHNFFATITIYIALSVLAISCNTTTGETKNNPTNTELAEAKPDMAKVKAEIQALNTIWANAVNNKDATTILSLYADDAISMPDDAPALMGKAAIQKDVKSSTDNSKGLISVTYITEEVFGDEQLVTERGNVIAKDTAGKIAYTEKYIQIWEKRTNKWQVIREIYNHDARKK
ncbi:MAG: hypothetical protein RLZZ316_3164 [Bacteroidota bacterium]